jgi:hypothetical protein
MPDYMHVTSDGKLIVDETTGKLFAGDTCCCGIFAIVIWNSNAARDDNFKVVLNGTELGTINNNASDYTGRIFSLDAAITPANISVQQPNAFEPTIVFNAALLINGTNTLRIESIQDNNNGNFGEVRVAKWILTGGQYAIHGTPYVSASYSFADGVGNGQDYTFSYP